MLVRPLLVSQRRGELAVRIGVSPWDIESSHSGMLPLMFLNFNSDAPYGFFLRITWV